VVSASADREIGEYSYFKSHVEWTQAKDFASCRKLAYDRRFKIFGLNSKPTKLFCTGNYKKRNKVPFRSITLFKFFW